MNQKIQVEVYGTNPKEMNWYNFPRLFNVIDCSDMSYFSNQKVDTKKLEKAEAKLQQKQQIKKEKNSNAPSNATASQVLTKKETRMEAKGTNNCKDIRIENFDIAYGDK